MIKLNPIEMLITLALYSAYIEGEKPLSLLLVSKVESGKTSLLERFKGCKGTEWLGDATAWGIAKTYGKQIRNGEIRHLLFPEMSIPTSRSYETVSSLDAYLCGLIEEGVGKIVSFKFGDVKTESPMGCGIIACISNQDFSSKQKIWFRIGLMSRLLPVSYDYSLVTRKEIMNYIKAREYRKETRLKLIFPTQQIAMELPLNIADKLERITETITTGTELYGYRWQKHLQRLVLAHALTRGNTTADDVDFIVIEKLSKYLTTDCKIQI